MRGEKKATCAEEGYTGDIYCKDCGEKLVTGEVTAKLTDHNWDEGVVTKEPTTADEGEKTYTCICCGKTSTEKIPAVSIPQKGVVLTDEKTGGEYEVTAFDNKKRTVEYKKPVKGNTKAVTVPAVISIDGVSYKVTSIAKNAFKNNKNIVRLTVGDSVTTIGANAFSGCSKLKTVKLGNNVTTINNNAFYKCTALTKIVIPKKVKKIGKQAFYGCKKLTSIKIVTTKLTNKSVGNKAFAGTPKKVVVKVPNGKLNAYQKLLVSKGIYKRTNIKK